MHTKVSRTLIRLIALLVILTLIPTGVSLADSDRPSEIAIPFEGEPISDEVTERGLATEDSASLMGGDLFQAGADRLAALQNNDGGWDWPLNDGNPNTDSPKNTVGPIAQGLAQAYLHTNDPDHLSALLDAGTLLLAKTNNFSPSDGYLAATLDDIFGGTTYTDHVIDNFYTPLANGTYNRNGSGTLYSTASYVNLIRTSRAGTQANLAAWDIGMGLVAAAAAGADTTAWIAGVKAEIDELNPSAAVYYDVIGLAGAIYGLAYVGEEYNPSAGVHAAAENLADLGAILADYQLATGGFTWHSASQDEGQDNEAVQETAYAVLALEKLDRAAHLSAIESAADYMESVQLATGGWQSYTAAGENNEITGEALWAIHIVYPLSEVWACPSGDCGHPGMSFNTIQEAIDAAQVGGIVHVAAGTYAESVVVNKVLTLEGAGSDSDEAANTIISGSGSGTGLSLPAGTDAAQRVIVKDLRVTGFGTGVVASSYNTLNNVASISNVTYGINLNPLQDLLITGSKFNENGVGLKIASTASVDNVTITQSQFNGNTNHGWYSDKAVGSTSNITNLSISFTTFNDNVNKGFYTEKLSDAVFDHITINNSGTGGAINHRAGMDLNLKYGEYSNIQILNSTITNNGTGDDNGGGILIKARSTGSYASSPATLDNVTLDKLVVTGNGGGTYAAGIRIGESNNSFTGIDAGPTNVTISNSVITGNVAHGVRNATAGTTVDASPNWWGSESPVWTSSVSGDVTYSPWCGDAACSFLLEPTGRWYIRGMGMFPFGTSSGIPVPADYDGDGKVDKAVFEPSNSTWSIDGVGSFTYGTTGDIPVPADYNGDGKADIAVFRPSNSTWYIHGVGPSLYGTVGDIPVVGDYNGDGKDDIAVFRPSNSTWYIRGIGPSLYGTVDDIPVVGDYNGDGKDDIAVFRPSNSTWYVRGIGPSLYGTVDDIPAVGDFNGDGKTDIAVFRPSNSTWYVRGIGPSVYGTAGDIPVVGDYNGDGKDDIAVFRP